MLRKTNVGLLRAELVKLGRQALPRWLGTALLVLAFLRGVVWPPEPSLPWAGLWSVTLIAATLVILAAVTTGQEFSENTFRSLVSRGVPRWALPLSKFVILILVGGLLLVVIEGLVTLLGVRPALDWAELARAWLGLWPYVALIVLLAVLARNGGLALVVGVMWLFAEYAFAALMGTFAVLSDTPALQFVSPKGTLGALVPWTLAYNSTNWTYLGAFQDAPMPFNLLLLAIPRPPLYSALMLGGLTLLGLGLSILILYHRDLTEVVEGKKGKRRGPSRAARQGLPRWTGRGPTVLRLARSHLFRMGRTSLVKIGTAVSLLFPLTLWAVSLALSQAGLEDYLFGAGPDGSPPLAASISLLLVGPLATVIAVLAVGNELRLGTRRAELTRGITRLQALVAQSLALVLTLGAMFGVVMAVVLLIGASRTGTWALGNAALAVGVAMLASAVYVGATHVGGALTRSPLGTMVFGLGFLLVDWFGILLPSLMLPEPGLLLDLGRYVVFANTFALATGGRIVGIDAAWPHLSRAGALLLLVGYALTSHALAALIARWRDA
jgi:ABC-type transport system involved in multi-copper enzyme maturation permease subunit